MKFRVQAHDPQAAALRNDSVERLGLSLRRLRWLVARVTVRLENVDDPRSGVDKRCSVEVTTRSVGRIVVSATAHSWHESVQIVASRVRQIVVERFRRAIIVRVAQLPRARRVPPALRRFGRMSPQH